MSPYTAPRWALPRRGLGVRLISLIGAPADDISRDAPVRVRISASRSSTVRIDMAASRVIVYQAAEPLILSEAPEIRAFTRSAL